MRARAVVGGAGRAVPEVGVVEQHVAALAVDGHLAGHLLEAGRHAVGAAEVRAGHDAQEAVRGDVASRWMVNATDGHTVEVRPRLRVGVPADARVAGLLAGAGVLVHDAEAVVLEQPRVGAEQAGGERRRAPGGSTTARASGDTSVTWHT